MDLVKGALGAMGGRGTIKLEGAAAKSAALMEQAKHQLDVERITSGRQLQVKDFYQTLYKRNFIP